jgi:hypothetical protein
VGHFQTSSAVIDARYNAAAISVYLRDIVVGQTAPGSGVQKAIHAAAMVNPMPPVFMIMSNVAAMGRPPPRFTAGRKVSSAAMSTLFQMLTTAARQIWVIRLPARRTKLTPRGAPFIGTVPADLAVTVISCRNVAPQTLRTATKSVTDDWLWVNIGSVGSSAVHRCGAA